MVLTQRRNNITKKFVAILLTVCLFTGVISLSAQANESLSLSSCDYISYDLEAKTMTYHSYDELPDREITYLPGYFPNGAEPIAPPVSPNAVIGTDSRTRVNPTNVGPYCNTVYLKSTFSTGATITATGFMLGPSAVITAGHCVYNDEHEGLATSVLIIPAKNGTLEPYGRTTASKIVVNPDYMANISTENDWAIVELNDDLGTKTGWLGLKANGAGTNSFVYNTGYPSPDNAEAQNALQTYMLLGTGYVKSIDDKTFSGNWDASGGNSGGPVFIYDTSLGYTAIGILTAGGPDGPSYPDAYTMATTITSDMLRLFKEYIP